MNRLMAQSARGCAAFLKVGRRCASQAAGAAHCASAPQASACAPSRRVAAAAPGRLRDFAARQPIVELYRCVQSEGSRMGRPTVCVRTTGCTHRCFFGRSGGWCDSYYTSIRPEPGRFSLQDVEDMYDRNPQINEMMLTGGSPTLHPSLVNELTHLAARRGTRVGVS